MKHLNFPTFIAVMLLSVSLFSCSKQSPVIERTEVLPEPTRINEVEAAKLLSNSNAMSQTTFQIRSRRTPNFNWVSFWSGLDTELNFAKMKEKDLNSVLQLGSISCDQRDLDEFGKFISKMAKADEEHDYQYLRNLQIAHFACQRTLNSFQLRQSLSLYKKVIRNNMQSEEKLEGLEESYIDYLRFLDSLAHVDLKGSEIEILLETDHDNVLNTFKQKKQIDKVLLYFTALKGLTPYQEQLWHKPLNILLQDESKIIDALEELSFEKLVMILEQIKKLVVNKYQLETKFALNDLIIAAYKKDITKKKPSNIEAFHIYIAKIIQATNRIFFLQKIIFEKDLNEFLTANDLVNYELLASIKGMASLFLQENATRVKSSPYFLYLDQYVRRFETTSFQSIDVQYGDEIDKIDSYFNLRNQFTSQEDEKRKVVIFDDLCALVGNTPFETNPSRPKPGCFNLADNNLKNRSQNYRINDHSYFKSYDKNIEMELRSISGGVFNLSVKNTHAEKSSIQRDPMNDAVVFPMVMGFKYIGQDSVCFTKNNVYYLPFNYLYKEAQAGYLPENLVPTLNGYHGGNFSIKVDARELNIKPEFVALGGIGQKGAAGMKPGRGRNIQYNESRMAMEFVEGMEGDHIEYLYRPCRTVPELLHLLSNAEKGDFNGVVSTKAFIDLNYLDFIDQADTNRFVSDSVIFQTESASYCQDDNCITQELGKMAAQKLLSILIEAQNNNVSSTTILNETQTRFRVNGHHQTGANQADGKAGNNGELKFEFY